MIIYIGADHRGFQLKELLKVFLEQGEYNAVDVGNEKYDENDDYPDFAKLVAKKVSQDPVNSKGIVICRSGVGVDIVANKFRGIRCGLLHNVEQTFLARNDDDINVLSLSSEFTDFEEAKKIVLTFLETQFSRSEKDKRRIGKIEEMEKGLLDQ